jgi:hypothetical protein
MMIASGRTMSIPYTKSIIVISALTMSAIAAANLPDLEELVPGSDRSTVTASVVRDENGRSNDQGFHLRVHSGYPGGASLLQRIRILTGHSVDFHFTYGEKSLSRFLKFGPHEQPIPADSCFFSGRRMKVVTSSYSIKRYGRIESLSGSTMIHGYRC